MTTGPVTVAWRVARHPFEALDDPNRRAVVELLSAGAGPKRIYQTDSGPSTNAISVALNDA